LHTARELGETLLRLAQHADAPALAVIAPYTLGATGCWLGAFPAARQHLEEGSARYTPTQRRARLFRMGQVRVLLAEPLLCRPSGCWSTRIKPWHIMNQTYLWTQGGCHENAHPKMGQ